MRVLYLDCSSGIAGDMMLAALVDLGASSDELLDRLGQLGLEESWELAFERTVRRGITANYARVRVGGRETDVRWIDCAGRDGHGHGDDHGHNHDDHHERDHHDHGHRHDGHHDHGPHRPYKEIRALLERAALPARARERSQSIFWELAQAEAAVHGVDPMDVHFHEVGSTDAIIDVVGVCIALEMLDIDAVHASPLHVGRGFVEAAHGRLPIPAPATLRLLEGFEIYQTDVWGELVTPTGAAIVRALSEGSGPMPRMKLLGTGWGAGTKDLPMPNVLRAVLGQTGSDDGLAVDSVVEICANVDDMNPQLFGPLLDQLLQNGAKDAWVEPATMKKGRPGHILRALAPMEAEPAVSALILEETTTLGLRMHRTERRMLQREWIEVQTSVGAVKVKVGRRGDQALNVAAEFEDCAQLALASGRPVKAIVAEANALALAKLRSQETEAIDK